MFDSLASELKDLAAGDPGTWSDHELDTAILEIGRHTAALAAFRARVFHEWEGRKTWRRDAAGSAAAWLAKRSHIDKREWGSTLWIGRALCDMPLVAAAYAAGDIGTCHVRKLASLYGRTAAAFSRDEALLLHWAPRPLFTVSIGERAFAWMCRLASGEVVSPVALIPWITDAQLEAILFDGGGRAIEVSRRRDFAGALRRVIEVRDAFCSCGCGAAAERCQIDHIEPWIEGGMTRQENGRPARGPSNRRKGRRRLPPLP